MNIYNRIYFRFYTFYLWTQTLSKFKENNPQVGVVYVLTFFGYGFLFLNCFFLAKIVFNADLRVFLAPYKEISTLIILICGFAALFINEYYFITCEKWGKIVKECSDGGKFHSPLMDKVIDIFIVSFFVVTFVFAYILDNRYPK